MKKSEGGPLYRFLRRLSEDPERWEAYRANPEGAMGRARLAEEQRKVILSGSRTHIERALKREGLEGDARMFIRPGLLKKTTKSEGGPVYRFLRRLSEDPERWEAYRANPEGAMRRARLPEEQRKVILSGSRTRIEQALRREGLKGGAAMFIRPGLLKKK